MENTQLLTSDTSHTDCPGCGWIGYSHEHDDAEDGPRQECCEHDHTPVDPEVAR